MLAGCDFSKSKSTPDQESFTDSVVNDEDSVTDIVVSSAVDELFSDFIFNFAVNKKFQIERINFPLRVIKDGKTSTTERKDWKMDYLFMTEDFYTIITDNEEQINLASDTLVSKARIDKIDFTKKMVSQYNFSREDKWELISIEELQLDKTSNGSFLEFYSKFAKDATYQASHLENQVKFSAPDPDNEFEQITGYINPDTWGAFALDLPNEVIYNFVYAMPKDGSNKKVLYLRGIANGMEQDYTFVRRNNNWRLAKMNQ